MLFDSANHHPSLETFKKLFKLLIYEEKKDLWILVIYGICVSICSLVIPVAVQTFVNTIGFGLLLQPILMLTLIVFTILVLSGVVRALQAYVAELLQQRLFVKVALALGERIPLIQQDVFLKEKAIYQANYFLEVATLQKTVTKLVLDATTVALQVLCGMLLLSFYHPLLFILNAIITVSVCLFFFGFSQRALETSITESKAKYSVAFWLQELARKSIQFKTQESRRFAAQKTDELTLMYLEERKQHFRILFQQIIAFLVLEILMSSILLGVGGWLVVRGGITLGQLVASELVMSAVVLGLSQFGEYLETYYDLAAALDKLGQLFELPIEDQRKSVSVPSSVSAPFLRVKNLQYDLKSSLNFTLIPGEKIAWVGGYEHTRSHIMKIFYGMHPEYTGLIELDEMDYRYHSLEQIRSKVAYVGQTDLIQGSILENIQFGNLAISFHAIQCVLEELGIYEIFCTLPQGLQTLTQDLDLDILSQVKRKILLSRAVLSRPQLLILDISYGLCQREEDAAFDAFLKKKNHSFALMLQSQDRESVSFVDQIITLEGEED